MTNTYITVSFADKDAVKELGGRWDRARASWFVPAGIDLAPFAKWAEIKMDETRWTRVPVGTPPLYIDLVPKSAWFTNLRSELSPGEWDVLRKHAYKAAGNVCEVCGGIGHEGHALEGHERWLYVDATNKQKLIGISALCPNCHQASHMGLANKTGHGDEAMAHLMKVNQWDADTANKHALEAFAEWEIRSQKAWKLDLSWLKTCGISLSLPTTAKLLDYETHVREPGQKPADKRIPASSNSIKDFGEDGGDISVADAMNHFFQE